MTYQDVLSKVDHTVLKQTATWADIQKLCDDAVKYHTASICIPPAYVKQAAEYLNGRIPVCTVIGFPNGSNTTECKAFEVRDAVKNGAEELDMVVNIGWVKDGKYEDVLREINCLKEACDGKLLKVIIETCLLTKDEIIALCDVVSRSDADFIKTSTGFSTAGATFEDVELMVKHMTGGKKVKAAGGISGFEDGKRFIELGAQRLGTSRLVAQAKNIEDLSAEF
ncbi:MAG: deoxyribose-phosphate aldolase [Clostridia bacterium]|nr:deoxyribose-phosphate aldolase [Clostridia bacterium]